MERLDSTRRRWRASRVLGAVAVLLLAATLSSPAFGGSKAAHRQAVACTTSWTNSSGGSWTNAANWSAGVPTSSSDACIQLDGTYTVTLSTSTTVNSLQIGGSSGTQTLLVGSTCSGHVSLTTSAGLANGGHGKVVLTNADACGNNAALISSVTNAGALVSEAANGGQRTIQGNLTNTGTLTLNRTLTYNSAATTLLNQGAVNIADAVALSVGGGAAFTNGSGGSIVATGSGTGNVFVASGSSFTEGAGTTSGTKPVLVDDGTLNYTGGGSSSIFLEGSTALSGNLVAGQSLQIESTCGEHAVATAGGSFTNAGTIVLTNGDNCGNNVTLVVTSGTLTSSGTIRTDAANGGQRTIQGNLTSTGTLTINQPTSYNANGTTLTNNGAVNVADGVSLTVASGASFTNGAGSIVATGSGTGNVFVASGSSFTEGAGTTSGTKPVLVDDGTLSYAGGGSSSIFLRGVSSLSGNISAGQTLQIESSCSEHAAATASSGFVSGGLIVLTNGDGCGNNVTLALSSGTLTSSGTIRTDAANGGQRTIQGNLTSTGTLTINQPTSYNANGTTLTNNGAVNVADGVSLTVASGASFTNGAGGSVNGTGSGSVFVAPGSTFNQGAGTTTGAKPVYVDDGTLNYTGSGSPSLVALRGSSNLSGNLVAGQSLQIESTCGEHAVATAGGSFTNAGTIALTNGDNCGNNVTLVVTSGALTSSGTIRTDAANGGQRVLQGNLTNTGTLTINQPTFYDATGTTLTNNGAVNVATGLSLSVFAGASFTNGAGGSINGTGSGNVFETGGTFTQGAGTTSGSKPVFVDDAALVYSSTGASTIALRGASTLSGTMAAGQTLQIESTCGEHAVATTAGSMKSGGTIVLTNGDGCGNNVTLNLSGGTLTNTGTVQNVRANGGQRTIQGNLKNSKTVFLGAGATLQVTGAFTQTSGGTLKPEIKDAGTFGTINVGGAATVAGTIAVAVVPPFVGSLGQTYGILGAASRTGTFKKETGDLIGGAGLYYAVSYSATGVSLVVTQASISISPASGPGGTVVTVTGSGYLSGDSVVVTFTDKAGAKTTYPTISADGSGNISTTITIPAAAALGAGKVVAKSSISGVKPKKTFTVT